MYYSRYRKLVWKIRAILRFYNKYMAKCKEIMYLVPRSNALLPNYLLCYDQHAYTFIEKELSRIKIKSVEETVMAYFIPSRWENILKSILDLNDRIWSLDKNLATYTDYAIGDKRFSDIEFILNEEHNQLAMYLEEVEHGLG
jgi:hypothetical protein